MNNEVASQLKALVEQHGITLCNDPRRCRALLMDFCGDNVKEIRILYMALEINVPRELLSSKITPYEIQRSRLAQKLTNEYAMSEDAALWSIDTWAFALSVNVTLPRQPDAKVSKKADKLITVKSKIKNNSSHSAANGHQLQKHPITMPLPPVKTQALPKYRSKTPLVIGLGIGMFLLMRMAYPGIVDMISDAIPSDNNARSIAGDTQDLSSDRQVSDVAETSTDKVVADGSAILLTASTINESMEIDIPETTFKANEEFYFYFNNNGPFDADRITVQLINSKTGKVLAESDYSVDPQKDTLLDMIFFSGSGRFKITVFIDDEVRAVREVIVE